MDLELTIIRLNILKIIEAVLWLEGLESKYHAEDKGGFLPNMNRVENAWDEVEATNVVSEDGAVAW